MRKSYTLFAGALLAMSHVASAEPITITFTAQVDKVSDTANLLGGQVAPGNIINGTYTYESASSDLNILSNVGTYMHYDAGYGISAEVNGVRFETDPNNVKFMLELINDYNGRDNYLVRSYNNSPLGDGSTAVEHIAWQLDDPSASALSDVTPPQQAPTLSNWESLYGLVITGGNCNTPFCVDGGRFKVQAHVTSTSIAGGDSGFTPGKANPPGLRYAPPGHGGSAPGQGGEVPGQAKGRNK